MNIINQRVRILARDELPVELHNRTGMVRSYNRRTFLYHIVLDKLPKNLRRACYLYANDIEVVKEDKVR